NKCMESYQNEQTGALRRTAYRFSVAEKKEAVSLLDTGLSYKEVRARYQIGEVTLIKWRERYSLTHPPKKVKTYTFSERRSVLRAVEGGMSVREAGIVFGVSSWSIHKWIRDNHEENAELGTFEMKNSPQK